MFAFTPPPGVKIDEVTVSQRRPGARAPARASAQIEPSPRSRLTATGSSTIAIVERKTAGGRQQERGSDPLEGLPKVEINGTSASELRTELGTLLSFERSGVRYVLAGSVTPAAIEAFARGL